MKKILIILLMVAMAATLVAQTRMFEITKNSYDPYIAEKSGFDSLFVNPAGMAGQSEFFVFEVEAGTAGKTKTYQTLELFLRNPGLFDESATADPTAEDINAIMDLLADNLPDADVLTLLTGTTLDGTITSTDDLVAYLEGGGTISQDDANIIGSNANDNPEIVENAAAALSGDLKVNVEATVKIGTLIKGFGLGVYGNAYTDLNVAALGFKPLIGETGVKVGYGFNLGPFGIGVSGDFAVIGNIADASIDDFMTADMVYGYAWGIDAGMTFDILPSLTVGAVLTDIIGTYSDAGITTLDYLMNGGTPSPIDSSYAFNLDLDFGVTWAPMIGGGKLLAPKFNVDYYDFIGLFRTPPSDFQGFMNHMRFGAELELLSFINVKAMYYQEFFTLGAGVDLLFLEVFGEFLFNQEFTDIGGSLLVKLHF